MKAAKCNFRNKILPDADYTANKYQNAGINSAVSRLNTKQMQDNRLTVSSASGIGIT